MLPDRVSNPGPLTYESGALPIALPGPAITAAVSKENRKTVDSVHILFHSKLIKMSKYIQ